VEDFELMDYITQIQLPQSRFFDYIIQWIKRNKVLGSCITSLKIRVKVTKSAHGITSLKLLYSKAIKSFMDYISQTFMLKSWFMDYITQKFRCKSNKVRSGITSLIFYAQNELVRGL
jgi:hypothetical protein